MLKKAGAIAIFVILCLVIVWFVMHLSGCAGRVQGTPQWVQAPVSPDKPEEWDYVILKAGFVYGYVTLNGQAYVAKCAWSSKSNILTSLTDAETWVVASCTNVNAKRSK